MSDYFVWFVSDIMTRMFSKFSPAARSSLSASLIDLRHEGHSSARSALAYLRPKMQPPIIRLMAEENIHPEILLIILGTIVKVAALRAVVRSAVFG